MFCRIVPLQSLPDWCELPNSFTLIEYVVSCRASVDGSYRIPVLTVIIFSNVLCVWRVYWPTVGSSETLVKRFVVFSCRRYALAEPTSHGVKESDAVEQWERESEWVDYWASGIRAQRLATLVRLEIESHTTCPSMNHAFRGVL